MVGDSSPGSSESGIRSSEIQGASSSAGGLPGAGEEGGVMGEELLYQQVFQGFYVNDFEDVAIACNQTLLFQLAQHPRDRFSR